MKIGLILECQKPRENWLKNADELVCCHVIEQIEPGTEFEISYKGSKPVLLEECGEDAATLLKRGCCCVIIVWDLYPPCPWGTTADANKDHAAVKKNLEDAGIDEDAPVYGICIAYELESWFLVDRQVLIDGLPKVKASHIKKVKNFEQADPKTILSDYFPGRYTGQTQYVIQLLKGLTSEKFDRIQNKCTSFNEFVDSVGKCKAASK